jgi:hypothetical protein
MFCQISGGAEIDGIQNQRKYDGGQQNMAE